MIKRLFSFLGMLAMVHIAQGQKLELTAGISGNVYNYGGTGSNTQVYSGSNQTFGKKLTAGLGAQLNLKLVDKDGFMFNITSAYDVFKSSASVYAPLYFYSNISASSATSFIAPLYDYNASIGTGTTTIKEISVSPLLGYRLKRKKVSVDFLLGAEAGFIAEIKTEQKITNDFYYHPPVVYLGNAQAYIKDTDWRLKTGFSVNYHRFGATASYAHGFINLRRDKDAFGYPIQGTIYSQYLQLGLNYKLF
ncbi:outer membrane beta-barrel protein [Mucilaginibacter ginkgonis]|uniref:Outer membrane beta-barrel protein n=1 Tax=Mucilaginibacter ginkgonis TaxID=2682091 RepID=A0A6I4I0Z6_9SPHI|nr:outer membrane beta-barrel protein [Mucilaginibacter ginkgonis]QQL48436.1 outer membrane beta-barrel protein [Mucilaginibacter ginkgonis]